MNVRPAQGDWQLAARGSIRVHVGPRRCGVVRVRPVTALWAPVLAYTLGGNLLHDLVEGGQRSCCRCGSCGCRRPCCCSRVVASFLRLRRPVCERCGARGAVRAAAHRPERGHPFRRGATRRARAARARRRRGHGRRGGQRRSAWPYFATAAGYRWPTTSSPPRWRTRRPARARNGRTRTSRTTAGSAAPTRSSPTSPSAPDASRTSADRHRRRSTAASTTSTPRPTMPSTGSEQILGQAMKGRRDKMFLATKFCVADGHLPNDTPVPKIIEAVEASLRRLQTDHVDLDPHPLLRPRRAPAGAEHPRGLRPPEGAGQGALPRRQHAHAEPRGGRQRGDRLAAAST